MSFIDLLLNEKSLILQYWPYVVTAGMIYFTWIIVCIYWPHKSKEHHGKVLCESELDEEDGRVLYIIKIIIKLLNQ